MEQLIHFVTGFMEVHLDQRHSSDRLAVRAIARALCVQVESGAAEDEEDVEVDANDGLVCGGWVWRWWGWVCGGGGEMGVDVVWGGGGCGGSRIEKS